MKRVPLDIPKDMYEWVKTSAAYVGESVNLFIKRATYERAALECAPTLEEATKLLEEKKAATQEHLDSMEKTTTESGQTIYTSGQSPAGGASAKRKLRK